MDGFSGAAAAAGLLETAIRSLGRLRKAYERVKDAPKVFESYQGELKDIKILVETVDDEESLQTANVHSEVEKLKQIESKLVKWLRTTEEASKRTLAQFSHHLFSGSREEKQLSEMMKQLSGVKGSLCLHIQLSAVGVIRDMENKMVAKLDVINRVNDTLVELLGQSGSLRIAALLQNRAPRSDGTILLSTEDVAYLTGRTDSGDQGVKPLTERVIIGNMTQDQAVQVNGPIGEDLWKDISRLEIRDNRALGRSIQINYATTQDNLKEVRLWQREIIEEERKGRTVFLERADSGIALEDDD